MLKSARKPAKRERANALELTLSDSQLRVDREAGIIRNVRVLGVESKNRRTYPVPVQQKAQSLYRRVSVNISHPPRDNAAEDRPLESLFGVIDDPRLTDDGTRGDLHFLKSHPLAEMICEAAERFPENFGLSHNAHVNWLVKDDGHRVCESINTVRSVDLVCRPATTNGIFESEGYMDAIAQPAGGSGADTALTTGDDEPSTVKDLLLDGVEKIFDGEGDAAAKAERIGQLAKTLLQVEDDVNAAVSGTAADDDGDEDGGTESVKEKKAKEAKELADAKARLAAFERRERARDALEAAGVPATKTRITAVSALESEADQKALIEEFAKAPKADATRAKPHSVPASATESQGGGGPDKLANGLPKRSPADVKSLASSLSGRR